MRFHRIKLATAIGSVLAVTACADPTQNASELRAVVIADAATNISDGYVATPDGYYHRSCVHGISEGAVLEKNGFVRNSDGTSYRLPACLYSKRPFVTHIGEPRQDLSLTAAAASFDSGIIEAAQMFMPTGNYASKLLANYTVPAAPWGSPMQNSAAYFAYVGLDNGITFLKPVIQYGASGAGGDGSHWGMAAWACTGGAGCVYSPFKTISANDAISTATYSTNCPGSSCHWLITISDLTNSQSTSTGILDNNPYTYATGGRVEVNSIRYCDSYPINGVSFSLIKLYDKTGALITPAWTSYIQTSADPQCRFGVSSTANSVTLSHNTVTVTASGSINSRCEGLCTQAYLTGMTGSGNAITLKDSKNQVQTLSLSGFTASGGLNLGSIIQSITATGGNTITIRDRAGHTGVITLSGALALGGDTAATGYQQVSANVNTVSLTAGSSGKGYINLFR